MRWTACSLLVVTFIVRCQNLPQSSDSGEELNLDPSVVTPKAESKNADAEITVTECTTNKGEDGVCVPYYLCDLNQETLIEDGDTIIDIRAKPECTKNLDVCCRRPKEMTTPAPVTLPAVEHEFDQAPRRPSNIDSRKDVPDQRTEPPVVSTSSVALVTGGNCGYSNTASYLFTDRDGVSRDDRLYADFGEFPWMVAILRRTDQPDTEEWVQSNFLGGGSLIHPSVVITAAHKVDSWKADQLKIRAGEYDTNSELELYNHQDINVTKIIIHDKFVRIRVHNDIALLILETPVKLEEPHIGIGCLSPLAPPPGAVCFSMGWGSADFGNKNVFASILKKVKLPVLENSQCEKILRTTRLGNSYTLHPSLFCAGGMKGVDTCRGDGGSPIVCSIDSQSSRYAIYGMVAFGIGCGTDEIPGVYVNGTYFYEWVTRQFQNEDLDTKSYMYIS